MISQDEKTMKWQEDYKTRMNPVLLTKLLRTAVPVLEHLEWAVEAVEKGTCVTILPLNHQGTNQHGTHQAALISMSADYTGGIAISSLLCGVPIGGVHRSRQSERAVLWLASMQVKYLAPSCGDLIAVCDIDGEQQDQIRRRYDQGRRNLIALEVGFHANGEKVAIAKMTYYLQPPATSVGKGTSTTLVTHGRKTSARLIAGLRGRHAQETQASIQSGVLPCPYSERVAGVHGRLLAEKLSASFPQLGVMVNARTAHLDFVLKKGLREGIKQVVFCGVGLDMRMFRMSGVQTQEEVKYYELDLPPMLSERSRALREFPELPVVDRQMIEIDFLRQDLQDRLLTGSDFKLNRKTLFILEGCSMYFDEQQNRRLLERIGQLVAATQGQLWCDFVSERVVRGRVVPPGVREFFQEMQEMGEEFVFGKDEPETYLQECGFSAVEAITAGRFLSSDDWVMDEYSFVVATAPSPPRRLAVPRDERYARCDSYASTPAIPLLLSEHSSSDPEDRCSPF